MENNKNRKGEMRFPFLWNKNSKQIKIVSYRMDRKTVVRFFDNEIIEGLIKQQNSGIFQDSLMFHQEIHLADNPILELDNHREIKWC